MLGVVFNSVNFEFLNKTFLTDFIFKTSERYCCPELKLKKTTNK